jgi:Lrp/AsnC family transcriptional regulator
MASAVDLDTVDLKILALLQRDALLSTRTLALRAGVSLSPCWRRVQRLREKGFIKATVALASREKLGFQMLIFARVKIGWLAEEARADLFQRIEHIPEVLECHTVAGEAELMLKIVAPSVAGYEKVLFAQIACLPAVQEVRSTVTVGEAKCTTAIPLRARKLRQP